MAEASHRHGVHAFAVSSGAGGMEVTTDLEGSWRGGGLAAGDVVIFHSMTVHKGLANRTARLRHSMDARYQALSQPVDQRSLEPYNGCGSWEEIYAGWQSAELKYYWRRQHPELRPFDNQYYEKRDRMAFAMAERGEQGARAALMRIVQRDRKAAKRDRATALLAALDARANPA